MVFTQPLFDNEMETNNFPTCCTRVSSPRQRFTCRKRDQCKNFFGFNVLIRRRGRNSANRKKIAFSPTTIFHFALQKTVLTHPLIRVLSTLLKSTVDFTTDWPISTETPQFVSRTCCLLPRHHLHIPKKWYNASFVPSRFSKLAWPLKKEVFPRSAVTH